MRWLGAACLMSVLLATSSALAERTDPQGITGISPYAIQIAKGGTAFVAGNLDSAQQAFQKAVELDPKRPQAHYHIGQVLVARGELDKAEVVWKKALDLAGSDPVYKAKVLFVLADLEERAQKWSTLATAWQTYESFVSATPKANGYPQTGAERRKALDRRNELQDKYAKVKERIGQRLDDAKAKIK